MSDYRAGGFVCCAAGCDRPKGHISHRMLHQCWFRGRTGGMGFEIDICAARIPSRTCGLADLKRITPEVVAVQFNEVEGVEEYALVSALVPDEIERGEPAILKGDGLPVDQAGARLERADGLHDQREASAPIDAVAGEQPHVGDIAARLLHMAIPVKRNAPPKRGISVVMGCVARPLNLSSVKDADRQPLVTTGAGGGYLPIGALPTGHLPTGGGAGGGGSLRGRSAAAAALSIAKDAASAVRNFSMM